ncbi:MAG: hypothetical protein E4G99_04930 [Anaerolineales bacterium]|nr:MAG: hypothetical protein E4G99_04930 [Anaerolineales bacterium]
MRTLLHTLQDQDLGFSRIIAELWGFDLPSGTSREAAEFLAQLMINPDTLGDFIEALPPRASEALYALGQHGGRFPWNAWDRKHGPLRAMGPGRRDREQPWRESQSASETLWYRGLLGRAFLDTPKGPEEYAYVPREILAWLQRQPQNSPPRLLDPIAPPTHRLEAAASIIDDCTTLLAALRRQIKPSSSLPEAARQFIQAHTFHPESINLNLTLAKSLGLLTRGTLEADLEAVRDFLLADRMLSLQKMYLTWKQSTQWNDLAALPGLRSGSDVWPNDPALARETMMRWLGRLQVGQWYSLSTLIRTIYEDEPSFQRPGSNFDSWYLHDAEGIPLGGIEHWYAIEGALLHSLLKGPLRWFGVVQLGRELPEGPVTSFTPTQLSRLLEDPHAKFPAVTEMGAVSIRADGQVLVPRLAPRSMRYQLARVLDWEGLQDQSYQYRLSLRAISEANRQDLNLNQVRAILTQASKAELPPSIEGAIRRFEEQGYEASVEQYQLLRVSDASILTSLHAHPTTGRYIHEVLNDKNAVVRRDQWDRLIQAAARIGILIDGPET